MLTTVLVCGCSGKLGAPVPQPEAAADAVPGVASEPPTPGVVASGPAPEYSGPDGQTCQLPQAGIRHLTASQYANTLAVLFPSLEVAGFAERLDRTLADSVGFSTDAELLHMSDGHVAEVFKQAKDIAARAAGNQAQLSPCLASGADEACVNAFISEFGMKAFRSPLTAEEQAAYLALYQSQLAEQGPEVALRQLLSAFLMSSRFLYRTELGPEGVSTPAVTLTPYERASALSYFISDGPPDAALLQAAAAGGLETPEQIAEQTRRLLSNRKLSAGLRKFFAEYLDTAAVLVVRKDKELFPDYQNSRREHMKREMEEFFAHVLHDGRATFGELLTADYTVANSVISELYAVDGPTSEEEWRRVSLPVEQRSGFLTQLGLLSVLAHEDSTDMIRRGKFVRERLLCQTLPPPPENVDVKPVDSEEGKTLRELLDEHSSNPECSGCHALMDPIGYAFENYDAVGQWREEEASGLPLQADTEIIEVDGSTLTVNGAVELAQALAGSTEAQACFVKNAYTYAHGGLDETVDQCALDAAAQAFATTGGDLTEAVVAITSSPNFFNRARLLPEVSE